jgi:hypothetical protein
VAGRSVLHIKVEMGKQRSPANPEIHFLARTFFSLLTCHFERIDCGSAALRAVCGFMVFGRDHEIGAQGIQLAWLVEPECYKIGRVIRNYLWARSQKTAAN